VYNWGCKSHIGENVESLWHVKTKDTKKKIKMEKWWVSPELFGVHKGRHQDCLNITPNRFRVIQLANLKGNFVTIVVTQNSIPWRVIKFGS
jgi:hypothetical protein